MCQMNVVVIDNQEEKTIMENVTHLETTEKGTIINTLFEDPTLIENSFVKKIDFMGGKVYLSSNPKE